MTETQIAVVGGVYRHYKTGNEYIVLGISRHTETDDLLVNYRRDDGSDQRVWSRPYNTFVERTSDGRERFTFLHQKPNMWYCL